MNQIKLNQPAHWKLEEAKARFSEVVRRAQRTPQKVTVLGKDAVVVNPVRRNPEDLLRGIAEHRAALPYLVREEELPGIINEGRG